MLTFIFFIMMIWVFWKLVKLSMKAAWGITKILFTLVLLPIILIALAIAGFVYIAIPILVLMFFVWLVKMLLNVEINVSPKKVPRLSEHVKKK